METETERHFSTIEITKRLGIDCEMVGVGYMGKENMLARISIVNQMGEIILDKFVKPTENVVDYRTHVSGIRPIDIQHGESFDAVRTEVSNLLRGRILVGHAVKNDLKVLRLHHPENDIRDTSTFGPLIRLNGGSTPSLKLLARTLLRENIQDGEHNSVEDARATMRIYNKILKCLKNHRP